jgi:hypothetical protein
MRLMQNKLPPSFGGGFFGPKENVSCQSAANGSCSGGGIFAAAYLFLSRLEFTIVSPRCFSSDFCQHQRLSWAS